MRHLKKGETGGTRDGEKKPSMKNQNTMEAKPFNMKPWKKYLRE